MRPLIAMTSIIISASIFIAGCAKNDTTDSLLKSSCEFSGITARDSIGALLGQEDPDDWCDAVYAYPNPAVDGVNIRIDLLSPQTVLVSVYGQRTGLITLLLQGVLPPGSHIITWDLKTQSNARVDPGIYCVVVDGDSLFCSGDIEVK